MPGSLCGPEVSSGRAIQPAGCFGATSAGSPLRLSPEPSAQDLDERSDLFSFGLVLHEMATGTLPSAARPLRDLPAGLGHVISKCLEADRELRYQHASELRADIQRLKFSLHAKPSVAQHWKLIGSASAAVIA